MTDRPIPPYEYVEVRNSIGLPDQYSLEERINRALHDAGRPIGGIGMRSHCWLCRRHDDEEVERLKNRGQDFVRESALRRGLVEQTDI